MSRQKGDIMREVLISIQPKWVEKICCGEKTVEVRKTKPKLDTPFKVYIYETLGKTKWCNTCKDPCERPYPNCACHEGWGKVIGEFVCDRIVQFENNWYDPAFAETSDLSCVGFEELAIYIGKKDFGYGWHITDLVVYDEPRELSEFRKDVKDRCTFNEDGVCLGRNQNHVILCDHMDCCQREIKRPPQSWCYIEPRQTAD
jgi:predicted transcriptional regulator